MASQHQIRQYLAYWFQLGKPVLVKNGQAKIRPEPVIEGEHYSQEFETCWELILSPESGDCYLEGTSETIEQLLSPEWEVNPCCRCNMPVPLRKRGLPPLCCPCFDLPGWPDLDQVQPRHPISNEVYLLDICHRLRQIG